MRHIVLTAAAFSLVASVAYAQQDTPAQSGPQNPAVKGMHDNNSATPVAGANSFTMKRSQVSDRSQGLHPRRRPEEGQGWRLARQGDEGRRHRPGQRRLSGQRQLTPTTRSQRTANDQDTHARI